MERLTEADKIVHKKSFTLIETAVAIVILTIVLSSIVGVFSKGFTLLRRSQEKTVALGLAQGIMEEFSDLEIITAWEDDGYLSADAGKYCYPDYSAELGDPVILNGIEYSCELSISDIAKGDGVLKQIDLAVSWQSKGKTRTVALSTFKADY